MTPAPTRKPWEDLAEVLSYGRHELRMTNTEMADEIGLSRERVRQILAKAGHGKRICPCGCGIYSKEDKCHSCLKRENSKPKPKVASLCANCGKLRSQTTALYVCSDGSRKCQKCAYHTDRSWKIKFLKQQISSLQKRLNVELDLVNRVG